MFVCEKCHLSNMFLRCMIICMRVSMCMCRYMYAYVCVHVCVCVHHYHMTHILTLTDSSDVKSMAPSDTL